VKKCGPRALHEGVDYKATPANAQKIVAAWRETFDIELDPERVAQHLAALQNWRIKTKEEQCRTSCLFRSMSWPASA
jgi:hypothetical protein